MAPATAASTCPGSWIAWCRIQASTGSVGDSYDNALAETVNGLHKNELIKARKPWRSIEEVELATLEWVWWFNNSRLHSELEYQTPAEYETNY